MALTLAGCSNNDGHDAETDTPFTTGTSHTTTTAPTTDPTTAGTDPTITDGSGTMSTGTEPSTESGASESDTDSIPICGDGVVEGNEVCDDDNDDNTDDCLDDCTAASCGDGFLQMGVEECDDGNTSNDDDCLDTCKAASCGDGFLQMDVEACDDGNVADNDGCLSSCTAAACGDGIVWEGVEACDDGNRVDDDACNNRCAPASCGDGVVQMAAGEECDDANADNTDACLDTCKAASCGDGFLQTGVEDCDEGGMNNDNTGPCKTDCTACPCQGNDVMGTTCADLPMYTCGELACAGCEFDTSGCGAPTPPNFQGQVGPVFNDGCWIQCEGYLDQPGGDDIPPAWGNDCTGVQFSRVRLVCGASLNAYRYITVQKNVFKDGLNAYPEVGLITESKDQNGIPFMTLNQIYAAGNHPHNGISWWGSGDGCGEAKLNTTINNNACTWEASNCFGQNIAGNRYLWVYVSP
ncbi:MAG: DUF4215 domain-containing protein [Nannocystaceae bacterium]